MALVIPTPESIYRGNYASLPANTLKPPIEANRTVPVEINWLSAGQSPRYTIHFNARQQQTLPISQISSLHIDNSNCGSSMHVAFPDTQFEVICGPNTVGFYPVVTNSLEFWAWIDLTPLSQDKTIIQVLNFLPPPIFFTTQPGGTGVGTVRNVGTAAPITGGPITDSGTIGLTTPLAINFGGTGATTGPVALDNLSSVSGGAAGALTRSSGGVWSLTAAGSGTISAVNAGTGLTGGGTTGAVTVSLAVPVTIANGGTGGTTPAAALAALGAAPLANPVFTGDPQAPTPAPTDNDTSIATTAFVQTVAGNYLPLTGGRLSGGLASGPAATPVPLAGALTLNVNTVAPAVALGAQFGMVGTGGADALALIDSSGGTIGPCGVVAARRSRGTAAAPTAVQSGDYMAVFRGIGYGASAYDAGGTAINMIASENWTGAAQGSQIVLSTKPNGTTTAVNSLTLAGNTAMFSGTVGLTGSATVAASGGFAIVNLNAGHNWQVFADSSNNFSITDATVAAGRILINGTGTCQASSAWGIISDATVKTAIVDHPRGLADILKLQPRQFTYTGKHGLEGQGTGLIAQELEAIMPELVSEMAMPDGGGTVKTVTETGIIWPLLNAVKELAAANDELRQRLVALEVKVTA